MVLYISKRNKFMRYFASRQVSEFKNCENVLDFGCGSGYWLEHLPNAFGIDDDMKHIKECKKKGLLCSLGGIEKLQEIPDESVDGILFSNVIEHLTRKEITQILKQFHRILKPNGIMKVNTSDFKYSWQIFYDDWTHKVPFTIKRLKQCMEDHNFKIIESKYIPTIHKGFGFIGEYLPVLNPLLYAILKFDSQISRHCISVLVRK